MEEDEKKSPPEEKKTAEIIDFQKKKEEMKPETLTEKEVETLVRKQLLSVALDAAREGYPMSLVVMRPDGLVVMTTEDAPSTHALLSCGQKIMIDDMLTPQGPPDETPDETVH